MMQEPDPSGNAGAVGSAEVAAAVRGVLGQFGTVNAQSLAEACGFPGPSAMGGMAAHGRARVGGGTASGFTPAWPRGADGLGVRGDLRGLAARIRGADSALKPPDNGC